MTNNTNSSPSPGGKSGAVWVFYRNEAGEWVAEKGKIKVIAKDIESLFYGVVLIKFMPLCVEHYEEDYDEGDLPIECYEIEEKVDELIDAGRLCFEGFVW